MTVAQRCGMKYLMGMNWKSAERTARRLIGSLLLGYLLFFQGLVTSYAQATMLGGPDPATIICSVHEAVVDGEPHPLQDLDRDCCSTLCQAACATGAGLPGAEAPSFALPVLPGLTHALIAAPQAPPSHYGLASKARAPPSSSA
jgi:hypothetical protein